MIRAVTILLLILCGIAPAQAFVIGPGQAGVIKAVTSHPAAIGDSYSFKQIQNRSGGVAIAPSQAMRAAVLAIPGSKALRVKLLKRRKPMYAVKLKAGSRVLTVLVDASTGRVLRQ